MRRRRSAIWEAGCGLATAGRFRSPSVTVSFMAVPTYDTHVAVDDDVLAKLEVLVPLAPLHQPNNLLPIRAIRAMQPEVLQVACFDTAFHRGHPEVADRYAIPEQLYQDGVRRYGFHGLSYEYITRTLPTVAPEIAGGRLVVAHLGSGASMCAIRDGRSIDSTMGFTALDGLPMGTRPGQLDAGVILHLLTNKGMTADAIQHMLYHDCGLKGLSGISNDVRDLLASDDPRAKLALDYFVYRASLALGSLAASLEGLDAVVFTAGIGENAPAIRAAICQRARWLGIELDEAANAAVNAAGARLISTGASRVRVYVIPTDEERMIAHHTLEILRRQRSSPLSWFQEGFRHHAMDGENGDHRQLRASGVRAAGASARRGDARPRPGGADDAVRQDGRPDRRNPGAP